MRILVLVLLSLVGSFAIAESGLLSSELPSFSQDPRSNLSIRGIGFACQTFTNLDDALPCNPAAISFPRQSAFVTEVGFGNGYEALRNTETLLSGKATKSFVRSMFRENHTIQADANIEMLFLTKGLAASFNPYRVNYFSVTRNAAYPVAAVHALQEGSMSLQTGMEIANGLHAGLQLRSVNRRFLHQDFYVLEAFVDGGEEILKPKTQTALFAEPGFIYQFPSALRPRISLSAQNTGWLSERYKELPSDPFARIGLGISPPMKWGGFEFGVDYRTERTVEVSDRFGTGAAFRFGAMMLLAGVNSKDISAGVLYGLPPLRAGIVYTSTKVIAEGGETFSNQSVFTQFGFQM